MRTKSSTKHNAIIEASIDEFLQHGFAQTSMDQIAARAGVSKRTVYDHFGDKRGVFAAAAASMIADASAIISDLEARFEQMDDLGRGLTGLARVYAASVLSRRVIRLRTLMIREADRFPEAAGDFFSNGPAAAMSKLAEGFDHLVARGSMDGDIDTAAAAQDFAYLVLGPLLDRALLTPSVSLSPQEVEAHADHAVATFVRAYGPT